jgi:hypothetical protein
LGKSAFPTVNVTSAFTSGPANGTLFGAFWMIMSTLMFSSASAPKICATTPGLSSTPTSITRASFRSIATPVTLTLSSDCSSATTQVPGTSENDDRTCTGTPYFIATSTLRI